MFNNELLKELELLKQKNETAALAQVVRREAPSSGKPGDRAIITKNGEVKGWIGGGCTKGIIIKEGLEAIKQNSPRLVKIQPDMDTPEQNGVVNYKMTCMSGGSVEVYVEPIMPQTTIKIFGRSHIAKALCDIGKAAGFQIDVITNFNESDVFDNADSLTTLDEYELKDLPNDYVVVCTQGEDDAKHLLTAIKSNPKYIAFVASRRKANGIFMGLKSEGIGHDDLIKIKTPAGLDINAKTPQEVAISILAQIIENKRSEEGNSEDDKFKNLELEINDELYINPVCKIPVQKNSAKHILEYKGEKVYFCCDGCKESFEKEPEAYMN